MTRCSTRPRSRPTPRRRRALLESAERVALADHPLIPLYFYVNKHLVKPEIRGWYDNVMNVLYSQDLDLASTRYPGSAEVRADRRAQATSDTAPAGVSDIDTSARRHRGDTGFHDHDGARQACRRRRCRDRTRSGSPTPGPRSCFPDFTRPPTSPNARSMSSSSNCSGNSRPRAARRHAPGSSSSSLEARDDIHPHILAQARRQRAAAETRSEQLLRAIDALEDRLERREEFD